MNFTDFNSVKLSVFLVIGILLAIVFPNFNLSPFYLITFSCILLIAAWLLNRKQLHPTLIFGVITFITFSIIGFSNYKLRLPEHSPTHFLHSKALTEASILQLKIVEVLKPDNYNTKYIATVFASEEQKLTGKVLVSIAKDSLAQTLYIDDIIFTKKEITSVATPLNPHQFDYADYMKKLGVYGQIRIQASEVIFHKKGTKTLKGIAASFREHLTYKLEKTSIKGDELSILKALVLGQRRDISKTLYNNYAAAGAVHILAVSGLHVGILFFILSFLLKPLEHFKKGKVVKSILLILLLWCFAFITGLSPSVTRAVTMFMFFAFSGIISRQTSSMNTLFISFFVLLLINPNWLFHVGFQMSYLAVFFILLIQPKLIKLYKPKTKLDKLLWGIITVTFAAQIGIVPLSLYYFHQFPGLFFITNIVILPFLSILLGGGILIVVLAAVNFLPDSFTVAYNYLIKYLNSFINWVATKDSFLFQNIPFSGLNVVCCYVLLIFVITLWHSYSYKKLCLVLLAIAVLIGSFIWNKHENATTELVVFHKTAKTLIGYKNVSSMMLYKKDSTIYKDQFPIKSYRVSTQIKEYSEKILPAIFGFNTKNILVIDSLAVYPRRHRIDIVIVTQSPKLHMERFIDSLRPKIVVADGSNYKTYVKRWRKTCLKKQVPFHYTGDDGAFVLSED